VGAVLRVPPLPVRLRPEASTVDEETFVRDIVKHGGVSEHEARDFLGRTMAVHQPFMRVRHPETDAWMICARPR
jgi:hypothetical protein